METKLTSSVTDITAAKNGMDFDLIDGVALFARVPPLRSRLAPRARLASCGGDKVLAIGIQRVLLSHLSKFDLSLQNISASPVKPSFIGNLWWQIELVNDRDVEQLLSGAAFGFLWYLTVLK